MSEFPALIKQIFHQQTANPAGIYVMDLFIEGFRTPVVVDDLFPVKRHDKQPAFTHFSGGNELWVMLLEKAFAKIHGNYETKIRT